MTPSENLVGLAERVEALDGPSREVDAEIFRAIGAPVPFQFANKLVVLTFDEAEQCYFAPIGDMRVRYEPPAYTASLDAVMTLVPEGWGWLVSQPTEKAIASGLLKQRTPVLSEVQYGCDLRFAVAAATPALALCVAALRSRSAQ